MTSVPTFELWRKVWREGFAPFISLLGLQALRRALEQDDPALLHGATTAPFQLQCMADHAVVGACPIALCGWLGHGLSTVAQVENYFAAACFRADQALGEYAACRHLLNHLDEIPRAEMLKRLLEEVSRTIAERERTILAA